MQQGAETDRERHALSPGGAGAQQEDVEGCGGEGLRRRTHNHPEVGTGGREEDEEEKR